jgi:hypothetical protein
MDSKKEFLQYKYRDLKRKNPGFFVSHGMAGLFRLLSIPLMVLSFGASIASFLLAWLEYVQVEFIKSNPKMGAVLEHTQLIEGDEEIVTLFVVLGLVCLLILFLCITIRILGRQVANRNNYILELEELTEEIVEKEKL